MNEITYVAISILVLVLIILLLTIAEYKKEIDEYKDRLESCKEKQKHTASVYNLQIEEYNLQIEELEKEISKYKSKVYREEKAIEENQILKAILHKDKEVFDKAVQADNLKITIDRERSSRETYEKCFYSLMKLIDRITIGNSQEQSCTITYDGDTFRTIITDRHGTTEEDYGDDGEQIAVFINYFYSKNPSIMKIHQKS